MKRKFRMMLRALARKGIWIRGGAGQAVAGLGLMLLLGCGTRAPEPPDVSRQNLDRAMADLIEKSRGQVLTQNDSAAAWGQLGRVYHTLEFLAEARVCYERAAALDPRAPQWPHLWALTRLQDDPEAAIALFRKGDELAGGAPDSPSVRLLQALVERGRFDEATRVAERLLARHPAHAVARLELARMQLSRQELAAAETNLTSSLTNRWTRRAALLLMGQVRQRQGDEAGAAQVIQEGTALERPPDWPDPYFAEVQSLRLDRHQAADQINTHLIRGRLSDASAGLDRLLAVAPNDPEGLLLLGRLRYLEKRCADAETALRRHLAVQPDSLNGHMQLALSLLCQKRWNDAGTALRRVLALKPEFAPAHANLGYALARAGDAEGAVRSYREALRFSPGDVGSHLALAEELGRMGRGDEARDHLERAAALAPKDPRVQALRERLGR